MPQANTNNGNGKKTFNGIAITTIFTNGKTNNLFSGALGERYKDYPTPLEALQEALKNAKPESRFNINKVGTDKNGNPRYLLSLVPPQEQTSRTFPAKKASKNDEESL